MYKFETQLTKLLKDSDLYRKYYATNRYTLAGYGMPNCTAYSLGRIIQLSVLNGKSYDFAGQYGNGADWGNTGAIGADWVHSQTPKLGAIACFGDKEGVDIGGHVAMVEQIFPNGNVTTSNSAWVNKENVGNDNSPKWWFLEENIKITDYRPNVFYFKYYLYPPYIEGDPEPPTPPTPSDDKSWIPLAICGAIPTNL